MLFPMKIQPLDQEAYCESEQMKPPPVMVKSRLKRFFDRKVEKQLAEPTEFEPSSVCLDKMVRNFIELDSNDKHSTVKCGRKKCNCFNANSNSSSDDEFDDSSDSGLVNSFADANDFLKSLIPCASVFERNLLADTARIVEKNKSCKRKDELRSIVVDGLLLLKHNASICKSHWEKTSSYPAGSYEYVDVIAENGERVMIDIDFRSEFEVARPTSGYKSILQSLPAIFVGKPDRLRQIITITSESAIQSLKKKVMAVAPWRKVEYMRAKWLSPYTRSNGTKLQSENDHVKVFPEPLEAMKESKFDKVDFIVDGKILEDKKIGKDFTVKAWELPEIKPKRSERGGKAVTGLAFLLREKP